MVNAESVPKLERDIKYSAEYIPLDAHENVLSERRSSPLSHLLSCLGRGWCMSWTQQESCWLTWALTRPPATTHSTGGTTQCSSALRRQSSSSPPAQGSSGRWCKRGEGFDLSSSSPLSLDALQAMQSRGIVHCWKERVIWAV